MKAREINPFGLRIHPKLKEAAKAEANKNRRSLNTELTMLIEEGLECRKQKAQAGA